jgi:hypothetical protein
VAVVPPTNIGGWKLPAAADNCPQTAWQLAGCPVPASSRAHMSVDTAVVATREPCPLTLARGVLGRSLEAGMSFCAMFAHLRLAESGLHRCTEAHHRSHLQVRPPHLNIAVCAMVSQLPRGEDQGARTTTRATYFALSHESVWRTVRVAASKRTHR